MWHQVRLVCAFSGLLVLIGQPGFAQEAESCGVCHKNHYREWLQSPHSQSWRSADFQAQLQEVGSPETCGRCHSPESIWRQVEPSPAEQSLTQTTRQPLAYTPELTVPEVRTEGREEGVSCGSCHHVRILWGQGSTGDDFVGPYHTELGHGGRVAKAFDSFELCGSCHGQAANEHISESRTPGPTFHHSQDLPVQFSGEVDCAGCHMATSKGKLVQLSVFKEAPERTLREHSFGGNRYQMLDGALDFQIEDGQSALILTNRGVGHAPQISPTLRYVLVVSRLQGRSVAEKHEEELAEARSWGPGQDLQVALPFAYGGAGTLRIELFRKMADGFQEKLFTRTL